MSEYKCMASRDGVCRNVIGNGTKCNGYSRECRLRPTYESLSRIEDNLSKSMRDTFGIKGDINCDSPEAST